MSNMVINTNVLALNSHRSMKRVGEMQSKASQRLSSGLRINSAADDAAGLAISEKMRSQIRGLDQASKNAQDAISLIQTAEGGMQEIDNMLQRIRELTVQASNDTNEHNELGTGDRQKMQDEVNQLVAEIDSMAERVEFNKKRVINGAYANPQEMLDTRLKQMNAISLEQATAQLRMTNASTALTNAQTALTDYETTNSVYGGYVAALATFQGSQNAFTAAYDALTNDTTVWAAVQADATTGGVALPNPQTPASLYNWLVANNAILITSGADALVTGFVAAGVTLDTNSAALDAATIAWNANSAGQQAVKTLQLNIATAAQGQSTATKNVDISTRKYNQATKLYNDAVNVALAAAGNSMSLYFQVGANAYQGLDLNIGSIKSDSLGIGDGAGNSTIDFLQPTGYYVTGILDTLDTALSYVTTERSKLGAAQNRLEYTMKSLDISSENLSASESRIRDADMAKEMMNLTKANVLQQAATSMLAQANQAPQNILQLLR